MYCFAAVQVRFRINRVQPAPNKVVIEPLNVISASILPGVLMSRDKGDMHRCPCRDTRQTSPCLRNEHHLVSIIIKQPAHVNRLHFYLVIWIGFTLLIYNDRHIHHVEVLIIFVAENDCHGVGARCRWSDGINGACSDSVRRYRLFKIVAVFSRFCKF